MTELEGARALVTGANGGLGQAIAAALRAQGADLIVTGRQRPALEALARDLGGRAISADLADPDQVAGLMEEAGDVDILVANAALPGSGDLAEWDQPGVDTLLQVNLGAPVAMTLALLPTFRSRGSGHFVYISSLSGRIASPGTALYSATKFGIRGFAAGLRCDLHRSGIGCSVVSPGFVRDAGMFAKTGVHLPKGIGSVTSSQVASAVVKAIRTDRAEITVAPLPLRIASSIAGLAPAVSTTVQARFGRELSDQIVAAQKSRR